MRAVPARLLACAWLVLLVAGPVSALDPTLPVDRYTVTRWNVDDGLPHSHIHDISQDEEGFLWVSTWEGAMRFDGREFHEVESLRHPDGRRLPARVLSRDIDGSVLVGVEHLGLMRVSGREQAQPVCTQYPPLQVTRIVGGVDGSLWVAARDGVYQPQPEGGCERLQGSEGMTGQDVLALLPRGDGSLWVGNRRGLYRWYGERLERLGPRLGLPAGEVRGLVETPEGEVWIVGDHGVWRYRNGRAERLRSERAERVMRDRDGAIWVAGTDSRLLRYRQGEWSVLDERHGVEGHASGALFQGSDGLVWFGTTHGLFRVADGPVWGLGLQHGLPNAYVRSLLQTSDGEVWIGHSGGLSRMREARFEPVFPRAGVPASSVLSMAPASRGGIWAGTYNRGVLHVGPGAGAPVRALIVDDTPLATEQVRALLEEPDGTLWIGTERGLMAWRDGRLDPQPFPDLPGLPVRSLHLSEAGRLWIGMHGGLAWREADGGIGVLEPEQDYPALSAFDFHADPDGALWIASDRGLVRHREGIFRLYGREQGLEGSALFRILADDFDNLWVSGNDGVTRIPRRAFEAIDRGRRTRLDMQSFQRDDGMPSRQANGGSSPAGARMADGELWIPTAAGIAVFDPARVMEAHSGEVKLLVDRVTVDGIGGPALEEGHEIPAGARVVIRYTGVSLRNPNGLRYRYRMRGFDQGWVEAGQASEVTYTNLPAGRLRFEVQVARAPVDWSAPSATAQVEFLVPSRWWLRPLALAAVAVALLLLLAGLHQWLSRHQRRRQRQLEMVVARRTEELREKNSELEEASRQREVLMKSLAHQASHDPLTDLPNRRASDRELAAAIADAQATGGPLCVAIADVDRFKSINDRFGHQGGDRVLARVAAQLAASLRYPETFVARTGGEEFLALLRESSLEQAAAQLERVRLDIAAMQLKMGADVLACTISIGVVELRPGEDVDAVLRRADARLYEAKQQGRDRVVAG